MKKKFKDISIKHYIIVAAIVLAAVISVLAAVSVYNHCRNGNCIPTGASGLFDGLSKDEAAVKALGQLQMPDYVEVDYIDPSRARTTDKLTAFKNIVIHYVGNAGTTAKQNRNYFDKPDTLVCSHFLIGLDGEIIQCMPLDERSAASNHRNVDTVSIEVCHPDESGRFNQATYDSLVKLCSWLCDSTDLTADDLIRHHDITGKACPKHFVEDPESWEAFKTDVKNAITKQ